VAARVDAAGGHGHFVACDATDPTSVRACIATVLSASGRLDGIVHNSTSGLSSRSTPLDAVSTADLQDHIAVSLRGTYLLARATFPALQETQGSFVTMTSEAGFEGKKMIGAYAMVKAAQRGMVRALAREAGPRGVRVNAVGPLAMTPAMEKAFVNDPSMAERVLTRNPLRRLGDPATDIGPVVRFLLSDDSRYVTGQTVMVDGGSCPIS
jgi:3-oxoacyl-[acyl-carrier protein] reductase